MAGIVFTYGLSVLLRLQKLRTALVATVVAILAGVVMSTLRTDAEGEPGHGDHGGGGGGQKPLSALGVAAAIGASACSALRWVLTERYLARRKVTPSVFAVMTLQAPITAAMLLPVWGYMEASAVIGGAAERVLRDHAILVGMCVGGGALSFVLVMLELQLVRQTSALSLNVVGHLKDIVAICMAVLVFHEHISPTNVTGIVFTVAGTMAYSWLKNRTTKAATIAAAPPPGTSAAACSYRLPVAIRMELKRNLVDARSGRRGINSNARRRGNMRRLRTCCRTRCHRKTRRLPSCHPRAAPPPPQPPAAQWSRGRPSHGTPASRRR